MPDYVFKCKCGHRKDVYFCVHAEHKAVCPKCGEEMRKDYQSMIPAYHDCSVDSVDTDLTGDPIVYHTRGQLRQIAKENGCRVE